MAIFNKLLFVIAVVVSILAAATATSRSSLGSTCSYSIYVQTGDVKNAGTDSKISLIVAGRNGQSFTVSNLESWGQMGFHYDYFERGHLDRFQGNAACIGSEFCKITVISDGSGNKPGWYLQSVLVRYANGGTPTTFNVNQWLEPGHWSTTKSLCNSLDNDEQETSHTGVEENMAVIESVVDMA